MTYPTLNHTACFIGDLYFNMKSKSKTRNNGSADDLYFNMKSKSKTPNNGSADGGADNNGKMNRREVCKARRSPRTRRRAVSM